MNDDSRFRVGAAVPDIQGVTDLEQVGRGGFGTVFRGRQVDFNRIVAIKVLNGPAHDDEADRRFRREVAAMGSVSHHPNVVPVYATGVATDGRPYLIMPYLPGGTLADRLGKMSWPAMVDVGSKMSGALQAAHDVGVLHRDVKPANILWSAWDEPQLADFGIARLHDTTGTAPGMVVASLLWAAPEVLEGKPASPASDVYLLAASLHAAVTGRSPHAPAPNEPMATTVARIASEPPPNLTAHGVPAAVGDVVAAGLAKDPAQRPPTARAFGEALVAAAARQPAKDHNPTPVPAVIPRLPTAPVPTVAIDDTAFLQQQRPLLPAPPERRRRGKAAAGVLAALALVALLAFLGRQLFADGGSTTAAGPGRRSTTSAKAGSTTTSSTAAPPTTSAPVTTTTTTAPTTTTTTAPPTTAPITIAPPTTAPITTAPITTAPVTMAPVTIVPSTTLPITTAAPTTTTMLVTVPPSTPPPVTTPGRGADAAATLASYYDLLSRRAYLEAFGRLSADYQNRSTFRRYTGFYKGFDHVELSDVRVGNDLSATATLRYVRGDGTSTTERGRFTFVQDPSGNLLIDDLSRA